MDEVEQAAAAEIARAVKREEAVQTEDDLLDLLRLAGVPHGLARHP